MTNRRGTGEGSTKTPLCGDTIKAMLFTWLLYHALVPQNPRNEHERANLATDSHKAPGRPTNHR